MAEYPYTSNPANVGRFLERIQEVGTPPKVTQNYLEGLGFKSKADRSIIGVLKSIHFLDASGTPSPTWRAYRDREQAPIVLAGAIRKCYVELFDTYPDAYRRDDEALQNFIASRSTLGKGALAFAVRTFKILCQKADFESKDSDGLEEQAPVPSVKQAISTGRTTAIPVIANSGPAISINLQIQLPATDNADVYDKLFAAMKKHLLSS